MQMDPYTAKRIFERLRDECGFDGGYTIVKDYVRSKKRGSREMFVPLSHPPGHAQADFGEALVVIGGVEQKAYFFALNLPQSGRVASITGQARSTLTRENGQPTDSNLAQPSSVILLRARTPICASVF